MRYPIGKTTSGRLWWVYLERAQVVGSEPAVGLRWDSPGASACYLRDTDSSPKGLPLVDARLGAHRAGGFAVVDAARLPGLYELGLPDELTHARSAVVQLRFDGVQPWILELDVVAYDPYDGHELALDGFMRSVRHEHLTSVFRRVMPPAVIPIVEAQMVRAEQRYGSSDRTP